MTQSPSNETAPGADWLALGAALVTVVLWASAFVGIRAVIHDFGPGALALGRLLTGAAVLTLVVAIRRPARPSRRALPFIVGSGVLWFALYMVTLNTAERFVDAGTASMLVNVGPILIAILGGLFLNEGFPPRLFAGSAVAFVGAAVIGLATSSAASTTDPTAGIVLCLLAAAAYAVGVVLQKPAVRDTPALTVTWLACVVGTVVLVPFVPALVEETRSASPESIAWMLYLGAFPTALAFTTWAFALSRTTAGRLGSTTYLVPAIAIILGWFILGEAPPAVAMLGGAIAIGGVVIARSRPSRRAVAPTPAAAHR
ncbi:MAG TPA: DMT family transporter [Candidatus Limnocylindrales bacterium]|nr:DMT family transporter [Candidatus Limnocylindrales bacterium]